MSGSGDQATDSSISSTDSDNSASPPPPGSSSERKSADFSISAILSDETGGSSSRKKRGRTNREQRSLASGVVVVSSPCGAAIDGGTPLQMHKTGMASVPLSTPSRFTSRLYPSPRPSSSSSQLTPSSTTPNSHWVGSLNQSVSLSPFNIGLLLPLSPSPTSGASGRSVGRLDLDMTSERETEEGERREGFAAVNDSLGMLSTVAVYHRELEGREEDGGGRGSVGNAALSVGDGMARMRLESSSDTMETTLSVEERRSTPPHPPSPSYRTTTGRGKGRTPFILKRDRKRPRQLADSFPQSQSPRDGSTTAVKPAPSTHHQLPSSHTHHHEPTPLDEGYLSPTSAQQKSPQHTNLSFSPSIFLSQPANSSSSSSSSHRKRTASGSSTEGHAMDTVDGCAAGRGRHDSESDNTESVVVGGYSTGHHMSRFVTSTPIKHDKENESAAQSSGLQQISPTYLSPVETEVKRPRLKDVNAYETSSGSDSEAPAPVVVTKSRSRSQAVRHRSSKARTQLSPLLENACSPIAKTDLSHRPPSSLLTANFPTSSSSSSTPVGPALPTVYLPHGSSGPATSVYHHQLVAPQPPPPVSFSYLHPHLPAAVPFPFSAAAAQYLPPPSHPPNMYMGHMVPAAAVTTCSPLFPIPVSPLSPPNAPYFIAPPPGAIASTTGALFRPPSSFYYSSTPHHAAYGGYPPGPVSSVGGSQQQQQSCQKWGSSPLSTQIQKTGQIQSVPPWFIFEQNRPEGKRLRLTEAINRSLSETPSNNPKLPVGWTKYACGQTDDQIQLTQKARQFLQSGRRQLTFNNINT